MWLVICCAVTIAIVELKWFIERIRFTAIIYYIVDKGYTPPNRDELMECIKIVSRKMIEERFKS